MEDSEKRETQREMESRVGLTFMMVAEPLSIVPTDFLGGFMFAARMGLTHPEWLAGFAQFDFSILGRAIETQNKLVDALVVAAPMQRLTPEEMEELTDKLRFLHTENERSKSMSR